MNNNVDPFGINQNNNPLPNQNVDNPQVVNNQADSFNLNNTSEVQSTPQPMPNIPPENNMVNNQNMQPEVNNPNGYAPIMPEQNAAEQVQPQPSQPVNTPVEQTNEPVNMQPNQPINSQVSQTVNGPVEFVDLNAASMQSAPAMTTETPQTNIPEPPVNNQPVMNSMASSSANEALVNAFIDKNCDKIKNGKFNIGAFFLGSLYLFYRKMYLYAILLMALEIGTTLLFPIGGLLVNILLAIFINKIYVSFSNKKVNNIIAKNPNLSQNELIEICKKQGGTSILSAILSTIIVSIIIGIIMALVTFFIIGPLNEQVALSQACSNGPGYNTSTTEGAITCSEYDSNGKYSCTFTNTKNETITKDCN